MEIEPSTVIYEPHSMMHKAVIQMEPTKLELLEGYKQGKSGYIYTPEETSNVRIVITGRNWDKKRSLIYGSKSTEEANGYVQQISEDLDDINHDATVIQQPKITNLAVSGDFNVSLPLESLVTTLNQQGINIEYEPEQFPAAIAKLDQPESTFMLYSTGKFVIQGLTELDDIDTAVRDMISRLNLHVFR